MSRQVRPPTDTPGKPVHRSVLRLETEAERPRPRAAASVGSLVYLASVGVVATAIAGVFFSAGFLLLAPSAGGAISGFDSPVADPRDRLLRSDMLPLSGSDSRPVDSKLGAASIGAPTPAVVEPSALLPIPVAPLPSTDEPPAVAVAEILPDRVSAMPALGTSKQSEPLRVSPNNVGASAPAPAGPRLSVAEIGDLLEHGDALLRSGDLTSARLFYERAATAGDGRAALRLGATYDPAFLDRSGLRTVKGDPAEARSWYSRALDLGTADAKRQQNDVETKQGR